MAINFNLKIQKKDLWLLSAIFVFLVGVGYVIAYNAAMSGGNPAVMGHSSDEIMVKNNSGDIVTLQEFINQTGVGGGGITYYAPKATRGTTTTILESVIIKYCGDDDGCEMRIAMYDWDGNGRTASRRFLFYYNSSNKNWRADTDAEATNNNGVTNHVYNAWSCYFTDGKYSGWADWGDPNVDFGLLSWNQYNAECRLTIID